MLDRRSSCARTRESRSNLLRPHLRTHPHCAFLTLPPRSSCSRRRRDSLSFRYFGLPPAQPLRLAHVDQRDRYTQGRRSTFRHARSLIATPAFPPLVPPPPPPPPPSFS